MDLSDNGARLIAEFEGLRLQRYNDPAPGKHCTVGIGHLLHHGPCDGRPGEFDLPNEEAAYRLFREDARRYIDRVDRTIRRPITQNQFDAMVSLCFNIGEGAFAGSSVARRFNAGDIQGAADAFLMWNKAGGRVLAGLDRRRRAERTLFLSNDPGLDPEPDLPRRPVMFLAADPRDGKTYLFENGTKRHVQHWKTVTDRMMPAGAPNFGVLEGEERLIDSYETK